MKREFLMLAKPFNSQNVVGWLMSEKLDGMRAFWDGGLSRGKILTDVPYANLEMAHRYATMPTCTGLWSRYGNPIQAPGWFLDALPDFCLDGELYSGRGQFEKIVSITKSFNKDVEWEQIQYVIVDSPPPETVFATGMVRMNGNKAFWVKPSQTYGRRMFNAGQYFRERYLMLRDNLVENAVVSLHPQIQMPPEGYQAFADHIINSGGEGIILKNPASLYVTKRSDQMLKVKPFLDTEGTVVGYVWGRGKYFGLMGAIVLDYNGKRLELSGFTDNEREMWMLSGGNRDEKHNEGGEVSEMYTNSKFPRGSKVTFTYRELSADGIPKEARFLRARND